MIGFRSDDELRDLARLEHESIKDEFGDDVSHVDLGEDWKQEVYSAKEQLASDAFVDFDDVWGLVAHGSVKDARCGSFMKRKTKGVIGCLNVKAHAGITDLHGFDYTGKGFFKRVFHSCNRPECPSCGITSWAVREAVRAETRLKYASKESGLGEIFHIIVSPPKGHGLPFEKLKRYVIDYLRSVGVVGGCHIYHHFRFHGRNETFKGERVRYLKDNSHFHILGFIKGGYGNYRSCRCLRDKTFDRCRGCNGFEGVVRRAYDKTVADGKLPLIVKVKDKRKTVGGSLWYELSHAAIKKDAKKKVVVNWFGTCARRRLKVSKDSMPQKEHMCPLCGSKMQRVVFLGDYKDLLAYMAVVDERNKGLWLDLKDKDGNWLWRSAYADKYRNE